MKGACYIVLLLFCLVITGISQDQVIDESAFNAAMRRSKRPVSEWQGKARRISKTVEEEFSNLPGMDHRYKNVTEFDAAGSSRSLSEAVRGNSGRRSEVIKIANTTFTRNGIDNWTSNKEQTRETAGRTPPFESENALDTQSFSSWHEPGSSVEYKVRTGQHKGEEIVIFRRVINSIQIHPKDGSEIRKETINQYWMADDGRLVRFEQWINHSGKQLHGRQMVVIEWELDPKIVVTAPIVLP